MAPDKAIAAYVRGTTWGTNLWAVFEIVNGKPVVRSTATTQAGAHRYLTPNRWLVYVGPQIVKAPSSHDVRNLYPRAKVREAFRQLMDELGQARHSTTTAGNSSAEHYDLAWNSEARRWAVLRYRWDHGSDWFAFPTCYEAVYPW